MTLYALYYLILYYVFFSCVILFIYIYMSLYNNIHDTTTPKTNGQAINDAINFPPKCPAFRSTKSLIMANTASGPVSPVAGALVPQNAGDMMGKDGKSGKKCWGKATAIYKNMGKSWKMIFKLLGIGVLDDVFGNFCAKPSKSNATSHLCLFQKYRFLFAQLKKHLQGLSGPRKPTVIHAEKNIW